MQWQEVRLSYPNQWIIVEALAAHTESDAHRQLDKLAVIELCVDAKAAMQQYRVLHQKYPEREFYFVHTSRAELDILERQWLGIRKSNAALSTR
jgi:hypothetical protein